MKISFSSSHQSFQAFTCVMSSCSFQSVMVPADKAQRCPYLRVSAAAAAQAYLICMWGVRTSIKAAHTTHTHAHTYWWTAFRQNDATRKLKCHIFTLYKSFYSMWNKVAVGMLLLTRICRPLTLTGLCSSFHTHITITLVMSNVNRRKQNRN